MSTIEKVTQLITEANEVVKECELEKIQSGESFNIFSILDMERNENKTHSRFLSELLNPKGSHLKGNVFLKLFLETINHDSPKDFEEATVITNHYIGNVNLEKTTGGFIDIYIESKSRKNAITIENKIYAEDQESQIERYCKYKKDYNKVYYLTLLGDEPSEFSKGTLVSGIDYYIISYKEHIVHWLEKCIEECMYEYDSILKATIRQYIILIKKLTNTMGKKEEYEILNLILENFDSAQKIKGGLDDSLSKFNNDFINEIIEALQINLKDDYEVVLDNKKFKADSKILIKIKNVENNNLYCFGLTNLFFLKSFINIDFMWIGLLRENENLSNFKHYDYNVINSDFSNNVWLKTYFLKKHPDFDHEKEWLSLKEIKLISLLHSNKYFKEKVIKHIVDECKEYCDFYKEDMIKALEDNK